MRTANILTRNAKHFLTAITEAGLAEKTAVRPGWLQRLDPRAKLIGLGSLLLTAALSHRLPVILGILFLTYAIALTSQISIKTLAMRAGAGAFFFTGTIAAPALFLTPGVELISLPVAGLSVTEQGLMSASLLIARAVAAATLALLLVLSTTWAHLLKGLGALGTPAVVIVILGMTKRYIFLLLEAALELIEARQSRTVGKMSGEDGRRFTVASLGALLEKSVSTAGEVHLAMLSRGFRGRVDSLDEFVMRRRDWVATCMFTLVAATAVWLGWS